MTRAERPPAFSSAKGRLAILALALPLACDGTRGAPLVSAAIVPRVGPLRVLTANHPLAEFAARIAGDRARVEYPGPPDEDPATWSPERAVLRRYQEADLVFLNGPEYSRWAKTTSLSLNRVVDTTASFHDRWIESEGGATHSHGPGGAHSHVHHHVTTWLDPTLAILQAEAVRDALARLSPEHAEEFHARCEGLADELRALDRSLEEAVAQDPGRPLLASHPVYAYLQRRLHLNLRSVHWEPGEAPSEEDWTQLRELLQSDPARRMLWEGPPLAETAARLSELGVECFVCDPCASSSGGESTMDVLRANAERLRAAFSGAR